MAPPAREERQAPRDAGAPQAQAYIDEDLLAVGIRDDDKSPLFRTALGRSGRLGDEPMHRIDAYRMIRRRTAQAGFRVKLGCHVFRATGITAYLEAGGTSKMLRRWRRTRVRGRPSSMTAPAMPSRSMIERITI